MVNKHMKRCSTAKVSREMQTEGTAARYHFNLLEASKQTNKQYQVLERMWSNWNSHIAVGNAYCTDTFENNLACCYEVQYTLIRGPRTSTPRQSDCMAFHFHQQCMRVLVASPSLQQWELSVFVILMAVFAISLSF